MLDNSVDSNATKIIFEIILMGKKISKISITDNGTGIIKEDFPSLCKRYHTSKIT